RREDLSHGGAGAAAKPGKPAGDRDTAHRCLEGAQREAAGIVGIAADRQIADLAGGAAGTPQEMAVGDDPHADAGPECDENEVVQAGAVAAPLLPARRKIDVV